jgi:type IV secretion system protein VirB10
VSQNTPPNTPGRDDGDGPSWQDAGRDPGRDAIGSNPYYASQQSPPPDLDAGAPTLKSADAQRLNRKALAFLAGIIVLLAVMGYLVFRNASSDKDEVVQQPREERVVIPELPQAPAAEAAAPEPIELAQPPALPPLPPENPAQDMPSIQGPVGPQGPTLLERRMMTDAGASGSQGQGSQPDPYAQALLSAVSGQGNQQAVAAAPEKATSALFLNKPDVLLVRGTFIRCVLETRIVTDVPGFTSCIVTEPVYSINGRRLLLPKGSKILGSYDTAPRGPRVAVVWDRITTPNGIDVSMSSPGVDNLGSAGHPGDYDAHWGSRITSALLISLLSDAFKYAGEKNGPTTTTTYGNGFVVEQPFQSNTARSVQRLADQALEESAQRPPTVTINQGTVVNVYVAKDVDFSAVVASL